MVRELHLQLFVFPHDIIVFIHIAVDALDLGGHGGGQLLHDAFRLDAFADRADAWGMTVRSYSDFLYSFRLADGSSAVSGFAGVSPVARLFCLMSYIRGVL